MSVFNKEIDSKSLLGFGQVLVISEDVCDFDQFSSYYFRDKFKFIFGDSVMLFCCRSYPYDHNFSSLTEGGLACHVSG